MTATALTGWIRATGTPLPRSRRDAESSDVSEAPYRSHAHRPLVGFRGGAADKFDVPLVQQAVPDQRKLPSGPQPVSDSCIDLLIRLHRRLRPGAVMPEESVNLDSVRGVDVRTHLEDVA